MMLSLRDLPLHLVGDILAQLDTIEQLKSVITSHRIFHNAFQESSRSITQAVLLSQVSDDILPFSIALLASTRAIASDAVTDLITGLKQHIQDHSLVLKTLADLSLADFDFLSSNQVVVQSLGDMFCRKTLPLYQQWFGSEQEPPAVATARDYFRVYRALYRYQILCNLFCDPERPRSEDKEDILRQGSMLMLPFAPWVNEQLLCVYYFLQRVVTRAYDELAAHDIFWGQLGVGWSDEIWWSDPEESRIQGYLRNGLEFIDSVLKAKNFDEKNKLLNDSDTKIISYEFEPHTQMVFLGCDEEWLDTINVPGDMKVPQLHEVKMLNRMTGPLNGVDRSAHSVPCRTWRATHTDATVFESVLDFERDGNLWMCGYVIWDALDQVPDERLQKSAAALRDTKPLYQRYRSRWSEDQIEQSEAMRIDLNLAGATGYWPMDRIDFDGVRDLTGGSKQRILRQWRDGTTDKMGVSLTKETLQMLQDIDLEQ